MMKQKKKHPPSFGRRFLFFLCAALALLVLLELLGSNWSGLTLALTKQESHTLPSSTAVLSGLERIPGSKQLRVTADNPSVTYYDIEQELKNFYWDVTPPEGRYEFTFSIAYTDETRADFISSPKKAQILPNTRRTNYVSCHYFGKVGSLRLTPNLQPGDVFTMGELKTNARTPLQFSFLRVGVALMFAAFLFLLCKTPLLRQTYRGDNPSHAWVMGLGVFGFAILLLCVYFFYVGSSPQDFISKSGDQLSKELVDAFRHGQLSLLDKPSEQLLNMEHPYQWIERIREGVDYKWDRLLYGGKYYSYYGIAPVLLFFLPYNLLTGCYFPTDFACLLFALAGVVFLGCAYRSFLQNWTKTLTLQTAFGGLLMLLFTSGTLLCVARPMFYEAAETAGFCFFTFGLWQLFASGILTGRPIRLTRLSLSAVGISLAVLSRPTFAVYAAAALFFLGFGFREYLAETPAGKGKRALRYALAALLPYAALGCVQMVYNYLRFGSIMDFGIQYSLTINDFQNTQFHARLAGVSIWNLLFSVPKVSPQFPFFFGNVDTLGINGYYFFETRTGFGLIWRALPLFFLLLLPKLFKGQSRKTKLQWLLLGVFPGLLLPLILVASTWESGYALRYTVDFAWQMLLLALAVGFTLYSRQNSPEVRRMMRTVFLICTVWCIFSNLALLFQHIPGVTNTIYGGTQRTVWYYRIAELFSLN